MRMHLLAVGQRMPGWVQQGYGEYEQRIKGDFSLKLHELPAAKRSKGATVGRMMDEEAGRILNATPRGARLVALDGRGRDWSTEQLAEQLERWSVDGRELAFAVGGPDGHGAAVLDAAEARWSLSPLTFPHPLVRVLLAEQLYRALTILRGHPYHRAE